MLNSLLDGLRLAIEANYFFQMLAITASTIWVLVGAVLAAGGIFVFGPVRILMTAEGKGQPAPHPSRAQGFVLLGVCLVILTFFLFLTVSELWIIQKLGFNISASLKVQEKGWSFEAVGVVAFLIAEPLFLFYLLGKLLKMLGYQPFS